MPRSFTTDADAPAKPERQAKLAQPATMRVHLDLLVRLHFLLAGFALISGVSLAILAAGTRSALHDLVMDGPAGQAGVVILAACGILFIVGGLALAAAGSALDRRRRTGRIGALALAVPNLLVVPFGTALSLYTFWVLLNDEARREFGRPPRTPGARTQGNSPA